MELSVAEKRLESLRALHVEMQVVLPSETDAPVHLDAVAAHLAGSVAHVGLADGGGLACVLCSRGQGPRRVVDGGMRVLGFQQHLRAAMTDRLEGAHGLA